MIWEVTESGHLGGGAVSVSAYHLECLTVGDYGLGERVAESGVR